jgi:DNA polymerase-4
LLLLSERVGIRLRKKGLMGRSVATYLRFSDRTSWAARLTNKEYFLDGYQIYQLAQKQLQRAPNPKPIRLVSIAAGELCRQEEITQPLFPEKIRLERAVLAMDRINHKYGELTIHRSSLLNIKEQLFSLPDGRNHRLYIPKISEVNPFLKRF